jgi:CBS domain-containing protein
MHPDPRVFGPATTVATALEVVGPADGEAWPVADANGLHAMVQRGELESARLRGFGAQTLRDLLREPHGRYTEGEEDFPHVHADHPLSAALERMGSSGLRALPVVSRANIRQLIGIVVLDEVIKAYGIANIA